ncbi:MAG TPA: hypothetical protein VK885_10390 [Desulfotignum sp.]|jgi:hypothetical protein|nr:hypothetical protein [Desulfotignum sp.]
MDNFTDQQIQERKKAIFDAMGKRGQRQILKKGYDKWDPFQEPKDPIDIRKDKTKRTSQALIREFLSQADADTYSTSFAQGALEMCLGIINEEEKIRGMFEFACWYKALLKQEGHDTL